MGNSTSIPIIITNKSDNKVYIPNEITIGKVEEIDSNRCSINEITLTTSIMMQLT